MSNRFQSFEGFKIEVTTEQLAGGVVKGQWKVMPDRGKPRCREISLQLPVHEFHGGPPDEPDGQFIAVLRQTLSPEKSSYV
jgi:hypothetical protein